MFRVVPSLELKKLDAVLLREKANEGMTFDNTTLEELAKYDPDSARAWMQAKLLTALLMDRLEREARFFSPWGYPLWVQVEMAGVS